MSQFVKNIKNVKKIVVEWTRKKSRKAPKELIENEDKLDIYLKIMKEDCSLRKKEWI